MSALYEALIDVDRRVWLAADLCAEVLAMRGPAGERVIQKDLAVRLNVSPAYISQLKRTALAFPRGPIRDRAIGDGATFYDCDQARRIHARLVRARLRDGSSDSLLLDLDDVLADKARGTVTSVRSAAKRAADQHLARLKRSARARVKRLGQRGTPWLNQCHNRDAREVLAEQADGSIKMIWLDPVYGQMSNSVRNRCVGEQNSRPHLRTECAGNNAKDALRLTVDLIRLAPDKLADGGSVVLFQSATEPDRPEVVKAFRRAGLRFVQPLYWRKQKLQPGNFANPFTISTERILVAAKNRSEMIDYAPRLGRSDIIDDESLDRLHRLRIQCDDHRWLEAAKAGAIGIEEHPSETQSSVSLIRRGKRRIGDLHIFQKPESLCRFFIERLTCPGELVFDACGCSGSMCLAAVDAKRTWIFVELDRSNYDWGVTRILSRIAQM